MLIPLLALTACLAKPLEVSVEAPLHDVSESLLALETINKFNSSSFFPLLSVLLSDRNKIGTNNYSSEVDSLFTNAERGSFIPSSFMGVVKQEFVLGSVWPLLEGEMQLFESAVSSDMRDCPVVYWNEGSYSCDKMGLFALQTVNVPKTPLLYPTDHVIGTGEHWVVAYADFDHPEFADWHATLLEMALTGKISYVLRHRTPITQNGSVSQTLDGAVTNKVAGYGVGVSLKRTDYLVIDDRDIGDDDEIKIDLESQNKIPESQVPFLDFAAVKKIREFNGTASEKLELTKNLSFNFPSIATKLAGEASVEELEEFVHDLDPYSSMGFNGLFIDGVLTKLHDVNSLFDALAEEINVVSLIQSFLVNTTSELDVPHLLTSGYALDTEDINAPLLSGSRYDLSDSDGIIGWLNDVETEPAYDQLQTDLSLFETIEGPFVPLRRNIHSIVVVGDLEDRPTLQLLGSLLKQIGPQLPLQIGFVSSSSFWQRVNPLGVEPRRSVIADLLYGKSYEDAESHAVSLAKNDSDIREIDGADVSAWLARFGVSNRSEPAIFINGNLVPLNMWREQALNIFETDADYLRRHDDLPSLGSLRDTLFKRGRSSRNNLLDPIDDVAYTAWPIDGVIQSFRNTDEPNENTVRHSILLGSSFEDLTSFNLADAILERSINKNDVDLFIKPLAGIDSRFYASMLDPMYNKFKYSRDLIQAARGHLLQNKTEPRVFQVAQEPEVAASSLPDEDGFIILDGRLISLSEIALYEDGEDSLTELLDGLLSREEPRIERLQKHVPGINGIAIAALTSTVQKRTMITDYDKPDITFTGPENSILVTVVADPASSEGQVLISLADTAVKSNLSVQVFLSPTELNTLPTRIFRPVTDRNAALATFNDLDDDVLYTVDIIEPPAWVTMTKKCDYDLSNLLLNQVKDSSLAALYSLHSLLIEGYAPGNDAPGRELDLYDSNGIKIADTMVMANLGYFQFQVPAPGIYKVCIPDKKFSFVVPDNETTDCIDVSVMSTSGERLRVGIVKQAPTHTNVKSVGGSSKDKGIWKKFSHGLMGGSAKRNADKEAEINIFTIASGHLYERFASIMMLSVMQHSGHSVKFWLIENFLSPKFKEFLPELAKENNFKYELVGYKWPSWLRGQSEKQRQIWGYKILFLDVIFPQSLSNVIFVDSDQIVRTDFKELLDIDLKGAPYAFTPMGDDREEMEPFRFWKQGFWDSYLGERDLKYHISALYRVDLSRFRQAKVGDILRQQYQRLSNDPQNLANLDQDLPNSLQAIVPIYSLPNEWLWCETWCSDEGLQYARTIDLCNNPLTKEPKLDRAKRQIPEWASYDETVAKLQAKVDARRAATLSSKKNEPVGDHPNEHKFTDEEQEDSSEHDEL